MSKSVYVGSFVVCLILIHVWWSYNVMLLFWYKVKLIAKVVCRMNIWCVLRSHPNNFPHEVWTFTICQLSFCVKCCTLCRSACVMGRCKRTFNGLVHLSLPEAGFSAALTGMSNSYGPEDSLWAIFFGSRALPFSLVEQWHPGLWGFFFFLNSCSVCL